MSNITADRLRRAFFAAIRLSPIFLIQIQLQLVQSAVVPTSKAESSEIYESGLEGSYPLINYPSAPGLVAPKVDVVQQSSSCLASGRGDDARFLFVSPRGGVAQPRPMILDENGEVVWSGSDIENGNAYDFKVQRWNDKPVLTYWTGDDQVKGHGNGEYHILDDTYDIVRRVVPANGYAADLHEFIITEENTAIMTMYQQVDADLSAVGGDVEGRIWESLFQELDLNTNEVLFEWRASDHLDYTESYRAIDGLGTNDNHWDWFHINSIDKDEWGNYLISARYTHSLMYIDGRDGRILWNLGGKLNDFEDLSNGQSLTFVGQHDARWHNNYTAITLFDNGADYDTHVAQWSRGMRLGVDLQSKTVKLLEEYIDPERMLTPSQGSMQVLSNGNVLIGYGFNAAMTEFDAHGGVLCDWHMTPEAKFDSGDVQSYRAFKSNWQGYPRWLPGIAVDMDRIHVSWNGATEVDRWTVRSGDGDAASEQFHDVATFSKSGFETEVAVDHMKLTGRFVRAVALKEDGTPLGETMPVELLHPDEWEELQNLIEEQRLDAGKYLLPAGVIGLLIAISVVLKLRQDRANDRRGAYTLLKD